MSEKPERKPKPLPEVIVTDPVRDGSAVIGHDAFDLQAWEDSLRAFPKLAITCEDAAKRTPTAPALVRDLDWTFYKRAPRVDPVVPVRPAYTPHVQILEEIVGTEEYANLRRYGTPGDTFLSAVSTIGVAEDILKAIPEETTQAQATYAKAQQQLDSMDAMAEALAALAEQQEEGPAKKRLEKRAARAQERADEKRANMPAVPTLSPQALDQIRAIGRAACLEAADAAGAAQDALIAYGGVGSEAGDPNGRVPIAEKLKLAEQVSKNPALRRIATLAGRLRNIALSVQETRVEHEPGEIMGVIMGRDVSRLLPTELALLADEDTEDEFFRKLVEGQLLTYDMSAPQRLGKGPIILAIDESGSMDAEFGEGYSRHQWSKGVAIALLAIAKRQRRELEVLCFASRRELISYRFSFRPGAPLAERYASSRAMEMAEHFYNGGTEYTPWMAQALKTTRESAYDRADVILLSDGEAYLQDAQVTEWNTVRKERKMRSFAVMIGAGRPSEALTGICDSVVALDDARGEGDATSTMFAI